MIQLCIAFKLQSAASFRAIHQIIVAINMYLDISIKAPTHSTVLLWVKKYGYYELTQPKITAEDWIIILDESVQFGQNKLLVIYGIRQSNIDFNRPLNYQDLTPLALQSKSTWSGQDIKKLLLDTQQHIGGVIKYAVADHGNSIKNALKLMKIPHVYDLTHCISLRLEHIYKEDPEFKEFTKQLAYLRATQALGKMSHVLPPAQRVKARFMNLRPISDWGIAALNLIDSYGKQFQSEKNNLAWVNEYRNFIMELALLNEIINDMQMVLKTKGLSKKTLKACMQILDRGQTKRLRQFKEMMSGYLQQTMGAFPDIDKILCSSDILESSFGKYKNYLQANPMVGITNLCLSISAFTGTLACGELKKAFETTKVNDIDTWTKLNIGKTTLSKRTEVLKMGRK